MTDVDLYAAQLAVLTRQGEIRQRRDALVGQASGLLGDDIPEATGIRIETATGSSEPEAPAPDGNPGARLDAASADLEKAASFLPVLEDQAYQLRAFGVARLDQQARLKDLFLRAPLAAAAALVVWLATEQLLEFSVFWGTVFGIGVAALLLIGPLKLATMQMNRPVKITAAGLGILSLYADESLANRLLAAAAAAVVVFFIFRD